MSIVSLATITSTKAQDLVKLDNMTVVNNEINNVTVQLSIAGQEQDFSIRINQSNVNEKSGFNAQFNADNTLLTLNFTQKFDESELYTLLEYCGFKFDINNFNQLNQLLNQ